MKLSEKIYYYRKKHGKSQEEIAEALDVSRQAVSKWETGESEPEIGKLRALASVFGVTVDFLLSDEDPREDATPAEEAPRETDARTWVDALPGVLGRLVSRYGWLAGVYLALAGLGIFVMGILAKVALSVMFGPFTQVTTSIGGAMAPAMPNIITRNPVSIMASFFIIVGVILMIGGAILAIYLKKIGRK